MATIGSQDYTNFRAVNLRGSVVLRLQADPSAGTFRVDHLEADRAWSFPDKSGRFPISGTFAVDLPIIAASGYLSTAVTVTGIRAEDGVVISPQENGAAAAVISARGVALVGNVVPTANTLTINFVNPFATATIARTSVFSYTSVR